MKSARPYAVVLVTAPSLKVARQLVRSALQARLVACGNLIPKLESHYWWQGAIETSDEVLILFKTRSSALARLEKFLLAAHPYDTPEMLALPIGHGTPRYLRWLSECVP